MDDPALHAGREIVQGDFVMLQIGDGFNPQKECAVVV
jgi:hypothetical protein